MEESDAGRGPAAQLAEGIREGLEFAFEQFRVRYTAPFYRYFRHHGLSEGAAMDLAATLVTDIPLLVRDHFPPGHPSFDAWVNLLRNRAMANWWRKEKRMDTVMLRIDTVDAVEDAVEPEGEPMAAVTEALEQLEEIDREILLQRYGGQIQPTFGDIAAELGRIHGREFKEFTIRQRHARALSRLRGTLRRDPRLNGILARL